jgi:hypothetical protein
MVLCQSVQAHNHHHRPRISLDLVDHVADPGDHLVRAFPGCLELRLLSSDPGRVVQSLLVSILESYELGQSVVLGLSAFRYAGRNDGCDAADPPGHPRCWSLSCRAVTKRIVELATDPEQGLRDRVLKFEAF